MVMDSRDSCTSAGGLPSHIYLYLTTLLGSTALAGLTVTSAKSAQQQVWILSGLSFISSSCDDNEDVLIEEWKSALQLGKNRVVIRQWKASACWWNLNRNHQQGMTNIEDDGIHVLARSEVEGYRIAQKALSNIYIPSVLYFSGDGKTDPTCRTYNSERPWAIFSYVGRNSSLFGLNDWKPDEYWMDCMVKNRFEFGFEEPHPRWGRVPADKSLDYALSVLRNIIIPLHRYMGENAYKKSSHKASLRTPNSLSSTGYRYSDMVHIYQSALQEMESTRYEKDIKMDTTLDLLKKAIATLKGQQPYTEAQQLQYVLCHMDCQPQNLLFAKPAKTQGVGSTEPKPIISSVLDWEEAALADPRFELLLLCRKVCASREQAERIWRIYEQECPQPQLGHLQPWLALETVHSITSLLLQSMDLLGGGRSPWETKPDLWDKIQREIQRLVVVNGWDVDDEEAYKFP